MVKNKQTKYKKLLKTDKQTWTTLVTKQPPGGDETRTLNVTGFQETRSVRRTVCQHDPKPGSKVVLLTTTILKYELWTKQEMTRHADDSYK